MLIGGLQKTTLIDFPGKVACTVFTVGCNFRCPYCHNKDLVDVKPKIKLIPEKEFFAFLKKRKGILDGVCITGGEPFLQKDLESFCQKIKKRGFLVKLDTNGSFPEKLKKLIEKKLVDFIAMDVKTIFKDYSKIVKVKGQMLKVKSSIKIILHSKIKHQFRTTVVPGIHNKKVIKKMAKELKKIGVKNWILQNFRPQNCLDPKFLKVEPFSEKEFARLRKVAFLVGR